MQAVNHALTEMGVATPTEPIKFRVSRQKFIKVKGESKAARRMRRAVAR